jgi:hypothetical protein
MAINFQYENQKFRKVGIAHPTKLGAKWEIAMQDSPHENQKFRG